MVPTVFIRLKTLRALLHQSLTAVQNNIVVSTFVLQHVREDDVDGDSAKLIGVYRTRESACAASARMLSQLGFCDHPNGFIIDEYELDRDHWSEGFGID